MVWYITEKQADGTYVAHVDVAYHDCNFTKYQVHTYVKTKSGHMLNIGMDEVDLTSPETVVK
ncbi:MAG: GBS Bsp-like repeat-containing protein [Agathobacter sp.]|nr:GBS Bsp-like repeat-containing protein [Agathobacter sp.]